jgi:ElaB/YqjD/DUF883 family membrane-anchored ribosome-binding protein
MEQMTEDPKIKDALELLNSSAKERKEMVQKLISEKYGDIKNAVEDMSSGTRTIVQNRPWLIVGGIATICLAAGVLIGRAMER